MSAPASAQLIGGLPGGLPAPPTVDIPTPDVGEVAGRAVVAARGLAEGTLAQARRLRLQDLVRRNRASLDVDDRGAPVVRGQVLALSPTPGALARAQAAGFRVMSRDELDGLGIALVTLETPPGVSAREAVRRLRKLDPDGQYDFNHIYSDAGEAAGRAAAAAPTPAPAAPGTRIGLLDGAVPERHPALAGVHIVQRSFAPGGLKVRPHGLAVASLLAGSQGRFRGAAPGATLYVADVYGPTPTGGSADALARALAWMAQEGAPVVNISLVGPPNLTLQAAVRALVARGCLIVAAVGNDGPAAPPLYPASYPGVVAVTAVDGRRRVLPEAGRAAHLDFAAPGSDMAAADLGGGFTAVRGTSFAAPIVAGRLAARLASPDPAAARQAVTALAGEAVDLGARGPDPVYGRGLVGFDLRTPPQAVGAKGVLTAGR